MYQCMDHQHVRSTSLLLLAAALVGVLALFTLTEEVEQHAVRIPPPPQDPFSARDQWVLLRGGEPERITPMARPTSRVRMRERLLPRVPAGGTKRVHRDRPPGFVPAAIVLHGTGSGQPGVDVRSLGELYRFFAKPNREASAHYAIDRSGNVMRMVADEHAAFHVARPGWNDVSIGIELFNDNSGTEPFSEAQLQATTQLVRALGTKYGIPVEGVVRHRTIQPEDRRDPANNFPWRQWISTLHRN